MKHSFAIRLIRYGISGGTAAIVSLGVAVILTRAAGIAYEWSQAVGFFVGIAVNYPLSRRWAFNNQYRYLGRQFGSFLAVALIGLAVNEGALAVAVSVLHLWVPLGMVVGIGAAFVWNFLANNLFTFGLLH